MPHAFRTVATRLAPALAITLLLSATGASAQTPGARGGQPGGRDREGMYELSVGKDAPAVKSAAWLRSALPEKPGAITFVTFWAPWCTPAKHAIDKIERLAAAHPDKVRVAAIVASDPATTRETAVDFLKDVPAESLVVYGWDENRVLFKNYVIDSGFKYLPATFVIDSQGKLCWAEIGDPDESIAAAEAIMKGAFNLEEAAGRYRSSRADEYARDRSENPVLRKLSQYRDAEQSQDWKAAIRVYAELTRLDQDAAAAIAPQHFKNLLNGLKDTGAAYAFGKVAVERHLRDDAQALNNLAWEIVDPKLNRQGPDLDLALEASERSNSLTNSENAAYLDTLARVVFLRGDLDRALELQKQVVEIDSRQIGSQNSTEFEERLAEYEQAKKAAAARPVVGQSPRPAGGK